jgi:hypothetical protein
MKIDSTLRKKVLLACEACFPHPLTGIAFKELEDSLTSDVLAGSIIYLQESGLLHAEYEYSSQLKKYSFKQIRITAKGLDAVFHAS